MKALCKQYDVEFTAKLEFIAIGQRTFHKEPEGWNEYPQHQPPQW